MAPLFDRRMNGPTQGPPHRHFGYWINRARRTARCYACQYQFRGDDTTAEPWVQAPGFGGAVIDGERSAPLSLSD